MNDKEKDKEELEALKLQLAETQELLAASNEQVSLLLAEKAGTNLGRSVVGVRVDGKNYLVTTAGTLPVGIKEFGEYQGRTFKTPEEIAADVNLVAILINTRTGWVTPAPETTTSLKTKK